MRHATANARSKEPMRGLLIVVACCALVGACSPSVFPYKALDGVNQDFDFAANNTSKRVKRKGYSPWTGTQSNPHRGWATGRDRRGWAVHGPGILCVGNGTNPTAIHCGIRHYKTPFLLGSGTCIEELRNFSCFHLHEKAAQRCWSSFHYSIRRFRVILGDGLGC